MLYNLSTHIGKDQFKRRCNELYKESMQGSGVVVELTRKTMRTNAQNSYLHLILGYFAMETGNDLEYVKQNYFKRKVNPELFVRYVDDKWLGRIEDLRSTIDLTTSEMCTAIDRFRDWSSREVGIYLPEANEAGFLAEIAVEMDKTKRYL